jgi:16S rRNA (guanine527-N7)-methyltransferase
VCVCVDCLESGLNEIFNDVPQSKSLGLRSVESLVPLLNRYCDEIERFNPAYGLVSVNGRDELVVKHILDSLAPIHKIASFAASHSTETARIADVGSGAGLPGIPLALALPDVSFTLIERMGRRAGFLRNTAAILGMTNVEILETEMEKAPPGIVNVVCFRAFRKLETDTLKKLFRLLRPKGYLVAYKGRTEVIYAEMQSVAEYLTQRNSTWSVSPCKVPFLNDERNIVLVSDSINEECACK